MIRKQKRTPQPITKKRFFIETGLGLTLYCFFAWCMIGYTSMKGSAAEVLQEFTGVLIGSILFYLALLVLVWIRGRQRFKEWTVRDGAVLGGIGIGGILAGLAVLWITAQVMPR